MLTARSPPPDTPLHAHSGAQQYTSLKPVGDRVLVKVRHQVVLPGRLSHSRALSLALRQVTEEATVSAGGIMLPRHAPVLHIGPAVQADAPHSSAQSKPTTGTVVSLGDGKNAKARMRAPRMRVVALTCALSDGQYGAHRCSGW